MPTAMNSVGTAMNDNGTANSNQSLYSLSSTMQTVTQDKGEAQTGELPKYICMNCRNGFPRLYTVKNVHFPDCIKRLGNPHNFVWNTHPSCRPKYGGRRPGAPHRLSPKSAAATRGIGRAKPKELNDCICILCGVGFTRAKTVWRHFPLCVKRHGNPDNLPWNEHPSCKPKQRGRVQEPSDATTLRTEDDKDDQDEDMGGYAEPSAVAAGNDVGGVAAYGRSEYEGREEDMEMIDADETYTVMRAEQLQEVDTHVRDGRPLERRSANWLFDFQDLGEDGYVMPSVFSTHDEGSNEHVHRSVVPHHLVHPGLAYGANAMLRTSTPLGEMNDLTPYPVLPSDTLQPSHHPDNMEPQSLQESFFFTSSLPGAPYYGQTRRSPYHQASYRQTAMAASNTDSNAGAMEGDRTGELGSNLQTRLSRSRANLYAEEFHELRNIDPRLRTPNLQPAFQEAHLDTHLQAEQSRGSRNDPASLSSGAAFNMEANLHVDHSGREVAPYLPYFEQKAQNPESIEAFAKRMQDVKDDIRAKLHGRPGHVPSDADGELVDQLFKCRQHAQE
ncbi:hypothetical protein MMC27_005344 [Xylographa pallens]|nr:hypothetical protein [Xylographa pallens]